MQWEVFLTGIWFLVGALWGVCDFVIEGIDVWLKESFDDELKLSREETGAFVDAAKKSPREYESEGVVSTVLRPEHESCSTDSITTHMSSVGKYYAVRRGYRPGVYCILIASLAQNHSKNKCLKFWKFFGIFCRIFFFFKTAKK